MAAKKPAKPEAYDPSQHRRTLKAIGGSMSDGWNHDIGNQVVNTLWKSSDDEEAKRQFRHAIEAVIGMSPRDEFEGMIVAQLVACHSAAMECYRRAMLPDQSLERWQEQLNQANKLSRTHVMLLEGLNGHRGKGQQKVIVEHVHVYPGGQAIVGNVETRGGGDRLKSEDQAHAKQIAHASQPAVWSANKAREPVSVTGNAERPLPHARRTVHRRSKR
jgi:hypothetical protein